MRLLSTVKLKGDSGEALVANGARTRALCGLLLPSGTSLALVDVSNRRKPKVLATGAFKGMKLSDEGARFLDDGRFLLRTALGIQTYAAAGKRLRRVKDPVDLIPSGDLCLGDARAVAKMTPLLERLGMTDSRQSPDGRFVTVQNNRNDAGVAELLDLTTGKVVRKLKRPRGFSADGRYLVHHALKGVLEVLDREKKWAPIGELGTWQWIHSASLSPDGSRVAVKGSRDDAQGTYDVWKVSNGKRLGSHEHDGIAFEVPPVWLDDTTLLSLDSGRAELVSL